MGLLEYLDLSGNLMTGELPASMALMGQLHDFEVQNNAGLTGTLPNNLATLSRMQTAKFGKTGTPPPRLFLHPPQNLFIYMLPPHLY